MNQDTASAIRWQISTHSPSGGGSCVEVGWHTSRYSMNGSGRRAEAAPFFGDSTGFAVRDSTQRGLGFLSFGRAEWAAFLRAAEREAL